MVSNDEYVKIFTDLISEGFIVIDHEGSICVYNSKAREIFGIDSDYRGSHEEGSLREGDYVLMAINNLGKDDGNLRPEDLESLGIDSSDLNLGDSLVAISRYKSEDFTADYKFLKRDKEKTILALNKVVLGREIEIIIDYINRSMRISVDQEDYEMDYITAIGFMVILDRESLEVKFFQSQGYTARGESISEILAEKHFRGKGKMGEDLDVLGKNIFEIHENNKIMEKLLKIAKGENISISDEFNEINGFPTICSLQAVEKDNKRIGAALRVEDISELREIIRERDRALKELTRVELELEQENILKETFPDFIGDSDKMLYVKKLALKAAKSSSTVLILGESGTGKTELAKAIHKKSGYGDKDLIYVNCRGVDSEDLDLLLFGSEIGGLRKGYFELAAGGTIFLDEISELPMNSQTKVLQCLQNRKFFRQGGLEEQELEARVIASSKDSLEEKMEEGSFREDLYYRINVFPIWIPPLRERMEDIYLLIDHLIPKISKRLSIREKSISSEAINLLLNYNWPGNIRELEIILERAINLCEGDIIFSKHIVIDQKDEYANISSLKKTLEFWEKKSIENALQFFNGDKKMAMKALKVSKTTLYDKINKYNIGD